jgi:hypothetical protein
MTEYRRPQTGSDCSPTTENPADQPKPPGDGKGCTDPKPTEPPKRPEPKPCPDDPDCHCKKGSSTDPNCLEKAIDEQTKAIVSADRAKTFKADLEALLAKAKAAAQEYSRDKYEKLLKQWIDQDKDIAELIRKLVCAIPCWRCVIECYVCPLINSMHNAEQLLYGDGGYPSDVHTLWDLLYWHQRDKEAKDRRLARIKNVLAAWEKPAQTIEKALADDAKLITDAGALIGTSPSKAVYDVFLKLVPMHLAIAPPAATYKTVIDKKFTQFCKCDSGTPDDCCGPDVGEPSLRQRLTGPQPYLIDPNAYLDLLCCLVTKRYGPAKKDASDAEAEVASLDAEIKRLKAQVENGLKNFEKDAKGAIPTTVDCCEFEKKEDEPPTSTAR